MRRRSSSLHSLFANCHPPPEAFPGVVSENIFVIKLLYFEAIFTRKSAESRFHESPFHGVSVRVRAP